MSRNRISHLSKLSVVLAATFALGGFATSDTAHAATTLFWDADGAATNATGGTGTWDLTSSLWRLTSATGTLQTYDNSIVGAGSITTPTFAGTAGTVTLAGSTTINANTITLGTTGYIINGAAGSKIVLSTGTGATNALPQIAVTTGTGTVNAVLDGTLGLQKGGSATLVLGGANTYTGATTIRGGTLSISTISGATSNIGASTGATGIINFGVSGANTPAILLYTGGGETTDRAINLTGGSSSVGTDATIDTTGATGGLIFSATSNLTSTLAFSKTFTLTGNTTGNSLAGNIVDNSTTNKTSFAKSGTGTWTVTGASTYTGTTSVSGTGGKLVVDSAGSTTARLAGTSGITINSGTLLLTNSTSTASTDRINNAATVSLGGGTFASSNGANEGVAATKTGGTVTGAGTSTVGLGMLTLTANSTLDFDSASNGNLLAFSSFTRNAGILTVSNWTSTNFNGSTNSGLSTDDRLIFNSDQSGNLQYFDFGAGSGVGVSEVLLDTGFYEVGFTPVPEPSTLVAPALLIAFFLWRKRARLLGRPSAV